MRPTASVPCCVHEDDHILVVNKPPGWNTHAPAPYAGEGIYDWLRRRDIRYADLAIIHRLDKETSGVLVFAKTALACFDCHIIGKIRSCRTDYPAKKTVVEF